MPAPWEALRAVQKGIKDETVLGLACEREAAGKLAMSLACRNLVRVFFLEPRGRAQAVAGRAMRDGQAAADPPRRRGRRGHHGRGHCPARRSQGLRGRGPRGQRNRPGGRHPAHPGPVPQGRRARSAAQRGSARTAGSHSRDHRLEGLQPTWTWCIEAIVEDLDVKRAVFQELEQNTAPSTILATNTSSLLVRELQEGLQHPERVAGLHFFNPVHKMPLVEVVAAAGTREDVAARLADWSVAVGKTPALVKDSPGFLVNRILMPYLNEAVLLVIEGMRPQLIDEAMRRFGMPLGPLELLDQIGLDIAAHVAAAIGPAFGERFGRNPGFERMEESGLLGQKCGQGFYRYRGRHKKVNDRAVTLLRGESHVAAPYQMQAAPPAKLMAAARERLALLMVNEAAACYAEELAASAEAIDLAMVLGTGWAPHRGGPLRYAEDRGIASIVETLTELARQHGPRFEPCAELRRARRRQKHHRSFNGASDELLPPTRWGREPLTVDCPLRPGGRRTPHATSQF